MSPASQNPHQPEAGAARIVRAPTEPLSLSIVVPCFNEQDNVRQVVAHALEAGKAVARDLEVIVVNDGSRDDTGKIADDLARQHADVRVIHHERNQGYGAAVWSGLRAARNQWVFYTDGDGQFDLGQFRELIPLMRDHEFVTGYRANRADSLMRRINGRLWTWLTNTVLGTQVRDVNCAFKVFPRNFVQAIDVRSRGALFSAELTAWARRMDLRVAELPVRHQARRAGAQTGAKPSVILGAFGELLAIGRRVRSGANATVTPDDPGRTRLLMLAVFVLSVAVFLPSLANRFTGWDDTAYIVDNSQMSAPGMTGLASIWTSAHSEVYYPLTFTAFWFEHRAFGDQPLGYHVVNILLHAVNAALVLLVLRRLGLPAWPSALAAALFAVHPVQAMTVAWVAQQKNLLSCLFVLLCLLAWMKSTERGWRWYVLSLIWFAAALLSKSAVVGLPIALAVMDVLLLRRSVFASAVRLAPMLLIAAASAIITMFFEQKFINPANTQGLPDSMARILIAAAAPWWYLKTLAWPMDLSPVYPLWKVATSEWRWWLPVIAWVMVALALPWGVRKLSYTSRGWLMWGGTLFLVMLGPVLGVIPYGNMQATYVSDHFLYIACIGPFALAGFWVGALCRRRSCRAAVTGLCIAALAGLIFIAERTIPVFKDGRSMWGRSLQRDPQNFVANYGLGLSIRNEGLKNHDRAVLSEALVLLKKACELRPDAADPRMFAGEVEYELGDFASAEKTLVAALALNPGSSRTAELLAIILERTGRIPQALAMYEGAVQIDPANVSARMGLAQMYLGFARHDDALAQFREVVRRRPGLGLAHVGMATCLRAKTQWAAAIDVLRQALQVTPEDVAVSNMLALMLATAPEDSVRNGAEAVQIMERLVERDGGTNHQLLDTLAAAFAEAGRFDEAVQTSQRAAERAMQAGDARSAQESARRTELYRQRQPLRLGEGK